MSASPKQTSHAMAAESARARKPCGERNEVISAARAEAAPMMAIRPGRAGDTQCPRHIKKKPDKIMIGAASKIIGGNPSPDFSFAFVGAPDRSQPLDPRQQGEHPQHKQ